MYVHPFLLGVIVTLLVVFGFIIGLALIFGGRKK